MRQPCSCRERIGSSLEQMMRQRETDDVLGVNRPSVWLKQMMRSGEAEAPDAEYKQSIYLPL